MTCTD